MKKIVVVLCVLLLSNAYAFMMHLNNSVLTPTGNGSRQACLIVNNNDRLLPVELYVAKRSYSLYGQENIKEVEDEFLIIPQQLLLKPGEERIVNIIWNGDKELVSEQAYRLIGEEFPVPDDLSGDKKKNAKVNIKLLVKNMRAMYVGPEDSKADIVLEEKFKIDVNRKKLSFTLNNQGTAHKIVKEMVLNLKSDNKQTKVNVSQYIGNINLLAKEKRIFIIPYPDGMPYENVGLELLLAD